MQKNTKNALLLSDLGGLDENDLELIEENLNILDIAFKRISPCHHESNFYEDFSLQTFYVFAPSFLNWMINYERGADVWNSLKSILTYTRSKLNGEIYSREIRGIVTLSPLKFGIHMMLDSNTSYNFDLSKILNDELFDVSLDKILSFLVHQTSNQNYELPCYVRFSAEKKQWEAETFEQYLLRKSMSN